MMLAGKKEQKKIFEARSKMNESHWLKIKIKICVFRVELKYELGSSAY